MGEAVEFTEFKKCVIADIMRLNKRNDYTQIKEVKIRKLNAGFEVTVYMDKDITVMDGAIAKIIYKHQPVFALSYGSISVTVTNSLGKQSCIRFMRKKYVE